MKVLLGAMISVPPFSAGIALDWMQIAVGLRRLGHDVLYVEEVKPEWCVDDTGRPCAYEHSVNRRLFASTVARFGLDGRASQVYDGGASTAGFAFDELVEEAARCDVLLNVAGHVRTDELLCAPARRAYLDQDPVYTQLWHAEYGAELGLERHDVFFSVGLELGSGRTAIPDCGVDWNPLPPVVVCDLWPAAFDPASRRWTTIATWDGFSELRYRGEWYEGKNVELARFAELPRRSGRELEVVLRRWREDDGVRALRAGGWTISDTQTVASFEHYQAFIARSRAEIGIAKHAYVKSRCGWFSDRSAHYLASGKPVLHQSTGFERHLPTGAGLFAFVDEEQALAAIEEIERDYERHCAAARALAAEHLDYRRVLPRMLELATAEVYA